MKFVYFLFIGLLIIPDANGQSIDEPKESSIPIYSIYMNIVEKRTPIDSPIMPPKPPVLTLVHLLEDNPKKILSSQPLITSITPRADASEFLSVRFLKRLGAATEWSDSTAAELQIESIVFLNVTKNKRYPYLVQEKENAFIEVDLQAIYSEINAVSGDQIQVKIDYVNPPNAPVTKVGYFVCLNTWDWNRFIGSSLGGLSIGTGYFGISADETGILITPVIANLSIGGRYNFDIAFYYGFNLIIGWSPRIDLSGTTRLTFLSAAFVWDINGYFSLGAGANINWNDTKQVNFSFIMGIPTQNK